MTSHNKPLLQQVIFLLGILLRSQAYLLSIPIKGVYQFEAQVPNSESWAKVFISNLDPICGDIASVKVYKRSQGFQQWQFVEDANLEVVELLENNDSNAISQNLGEFNTANHS